MAPTIQSILLLCEGNHCRSPLAEVLLTRALGAGFRVSSAGLRAMVGHPAHEEVRRIAERHGLQLDSHRGRQVERGMFLDADLVLVMEKEQKAACEDMLPTLRGRVFLLGHWSPGGPREIPDPMGRSPEVHQAVFEQIRDATLAWVQRLSPGMP